MKKDKIYYLENADYAKWLYVGLAIYCSIEITWLVCFMTGIRASQLAIISLAMCPAFYYLLSQQLFRGKRVSVCMWILSVLIAASIPLGAFLDNNVSLQNWTAYLFIEWMLCVGGMIPLVFCMIRILLGILEKVKPSGHSTWSISWFIKSPVLYYFLVFVIILLCWLPVWLAYFPGLWNYDPWQVSQVINNSYSTHHPLIHTLLLGACYMFGNVCENVNVGVVLYDWIQMVVMAAIFSYTILFIRRKTESRILCTIAIFFYGMFPVNSIMVISSTKDVLFSGFVLFCSVFALQYKDIVDFPAGGESRRKKYLITIGLVVTSVLMMMFRNNAVYAFAGFLIVSFMLVFWKKMRLRTLLIAAICFFLAILGNFLLKYNLNAVDGSIHEALSVSSQAFARIYEQASIDAETEDTIKYYFDTDKMNYNPYRADSVKQYMQNVDSVSDVIPLIKESAHLFIKYPRVSIDAYLYLTEGLWYLGDYSNAEIYGSGLDGRQGYLLTDYKAGYDIVHISKMPELERHMENAFSANDYQHWPLLSLIFAPAVYVWFFIILFVVIRGKDKMIFIFHVFLLASIFLGPCCVIRYVYPFVVIVPLISAIYVAEKQSNLL